MDRFISPEEACGLAPWAGRVALEERGTGALLLANAGKQSTVDVDGAIERCLEQIDANMEYFGTEFPKAVCIDGVYPKTSGKDWTEGFWTGMLWLAYERTGDDRYASRAMQNVESFAQRLKDNVVLDHHDLGFLYTPSCVAAYKITGDKLARATALAAADRLMRRWQEKGRFIQAWGPMDSPEHHRFIVDCLMNIPLLFWASHETGDERYGDIAAMHFQTTLENIFRSDASTYHTFYMDMQTGKADHGATCQGYADDSSWARGQAWAMYGLPLNARLSGRENEPELLHLSRSASRHFLNRLPKDGVCYWDLIFSDGDGMPRDSSSAAIAACGLNEFTRVYGDSEDAEFFADCERAVLNSLTKSYVPDTVLPGAPLLAHSVYSWHEGKGVDEGSTWGDYFYFEALMRQDGSWRPYW